MLLFKIYFFVMSLLCMILTTLQAHGKTSPNSLAADIVWLVGFSFGLLFFLFKS